MDANDINPFRGTDLWQLVKGLELFYRIQQYLYPPEGTMEWILPPDILPGVTQAWGLPVRRAEGLPGPYLAHRIEDPEREAR